ncbi:MAG: FkbM family methyltransferase [Bacilli bacterium]
MEVITINTHGHLLHLHGTPGVIRNCWVKGLPYESPLLEHIRNRGFKGGLALDIGANIGNHSLWFSIVCGLDVIAFEPILHKQLEKNLKLNPSASVQVEPYALGNKEGKAHHLGRGVLELSADGTIPVKRLDDLLLENISFIKLDIEGMESSALQGGAQTIQRERPVIYAEAWGDEGHKKVARVLEPWGYKVTVSFHQRNQMGHDTPVEEWMVDCD